MRDQADAAVDAWVSGMKMLGHALPDATLDESGQAFAVTSGSQLASMNFVTSLAPEADVASMAELTAGVRARGLPWSIHVLGEPSAAVSRLADQNGLTHCSSSPLMTCGRESLRLRRTGVDGVRITGVGSSAWRALASVLERGFETQGDLWVPLVRGQLLDTPGVQAYIATSEGQDVGTAMGVRHGPAVGIFNVAVVEPARRRGLGRLLTQCAVSDGLRHGADLAYLTSTPQGERIYASLGFVTAATITTLS